MDSAVLKIWSPTLTSHEITAALEINPDSVLAAGTVVELRGQPIEGTHWAITSSHGAESVAELLKPFHLRDSALRALVDSGAKISLECAIQPEDNFPTFDGPTTRFLARHKIDVMLHWNRVKKVVESESKPR